MGKVFVANTESCIYYMGWLSEPFSIESGIRQDCPFSLIAFILGLELLALKIRSTPTIKGIKLPDFCNEENTVNIILKLVLYADDATLFLRDKNDLQCVLSIIGGFSLFSCVEININKTEAMWFG